MDNPVLFERLLHAETEDAVAAILANAGYSGDDESIWQPLGRLENNFAAVGNQQSDPTAALVEKVVNSIDAVLMAACYERGVDPEGHDAPQTMSAAVARFFGVRDGRLNSLTARQQQELAENIGLVVVGGKANPNYLIIDRGEGQTPGQFPATFLSLMRSNKMRIPFVQGKFNSGGTGVLQFCGEKNYQLIVSRRKPGCPVEPGDETADLWGFTIVRRMLPSDGRRSSVYVYLAPDGRVPTFRADAIKVLPGKSSKNRPAPAYAIDLPYGTCLKLYNYRWRAKSTLTTEGRYELEEYLHSPCLPFRVTETRDYNANYYSATIIGGWNSITGGDEDDQSDKLEAGFPAYAELDLQEVGTLPYQLAVYKEAVNKRHVIHGVFFLVNGQVHGSLPSNFITSKLKFDYLKDDLLVAVDCTAMNQRVREDFFMASRDRVRRNEVYAKIEQQLAEELRNHPGLKELNQVRRQQEMERHLNDEAPLGALQALVDSDPSLASLFSGGDRLATSTGPGAPPPFVGRQFPTFFRLAKDPEGGLTRPCPVNRTCRIEFETDAANDYFKRTVHPGEFRAEPPNLIEHSRLWNGRFEARFRVPWDANPGDIVDITVTVTDLERAGLGRPFVCKFKLKAAPEAVDEPPSGPTGPRRKPDPAGNGRAVSLALPQIIEVRKAEWERYDPPLTEYESIRLRNDGTGGFDCLLNVDNRFLLTELGRAREADRPQIKYWFRNGLLLSAVGMIKHQQRMAEMAQVGASRNGRSAHRAGEDEGAEGLEAVSQYCNGMAQVIVPIIRALSRAPVS